MSTGEVNKNKRKNRYLFKPQIIEFLEPKNDEMYFLYKYLCLDFLNDLFWQ